MATVPEGTPVKALDGTVHITNAGSTYPVQQAPSSSLAVRPKPVNTASKASYRATGSILTGKQEHCRFGGRPTDYSC